MTAFLLCFLLDRTLFENSCQRNKFWRMVFRSRRSWITVFKANSSWKLSCIKKFLKKSCFCIKRFLDTNIESAHASCQEIVQIWFGKPISWWWFSKNIIFGDGIRLYFTEFVSKRNYQIWKFENSLIRECLKNFLWILNVSRFFAN